MILSRFGRLLSGLALNRAFTNVALLKAFVNPFNYFFLKIPQRLL